jgi:hypothetical protein
MREDMLPVAYPRLPPLEELSQEAAPAAVLEKYFQAAEEASALQEKHFRKALKRIALCGHLRGALGVFGTTPTQHFSWCPYIAWDTFWQEQGWPKLPTVEDIRG